ncbi:MAG TPA: cupin domain-containing protein [Gemmatimonadaceae bacterium]
MGMLSFADLVRPLTTSTFLETVWGREYVRLTGDQDRFEHLLPWPVLNRILREHRFDPSRLRLVKDGASLPASGYLRSGGQVATAEFTRALRDGATLNINAVHELHEPIARLAETMEDVFHERVQANLYASWQTVNGFDLHWDGHDVFVVQVAGRKQWGIYGSTLADPVRSDAFETKAPRPTTPLWSGLLNPGELLYMPRGCWHVATPVDEPCIHLSFGVRQSTGADFLHWLATDLLATDVCRTNVPRLSNEADVTAYTDRLRAAVADAIDSATLRRYFSDTDARAEVRPDVSLPLAATQLDPVFDDATIRFVPLRARLATRDANRTSIVCLGRRWSFAASVRPMLERLITRDPASFSELQAFLPPDMTSEELRRLLAKMLRDGLIAADFGAGTNATDGAATDALSFSPPAQPLSSSLAVVPDL